MAPLVRPITTAVASIPKAPLVLVDIETNQGVVGRSYLFAYTPLALKPLVQLVDNVAEALIGTAADPITCMARMESMFRLLGRQGLVSMALAGIDMALWDACAKARDMSVAQMLGATPGPVRCYDSHGVFDPARDVTAIEQSMAQGFGALKFKIGAGSLQRDIDTLRTIRQIIGPDIRLMVDYNQSLTAPEAVRRISRFDEFDLDWVEEPVAAEDYAGHRRVRSGVRTAIQTGENWWMPDDAARAIQAEISDLAMLDIMKIGGVTGWQRAAAMTDAASLPVSSHIFVEASAHVLAATPNAHYLEYLDIASAVLSEPYQVVEGALTPRGPGLGLTWNPDAVRRYAV
jgi:mandelate racemase